MRALGRPRRVVTVILFRSLNAEHCLMICPFCRHDETKVVDSRGSQEFVIRRRRECLDCGRRFTTYEKIEESPLKVIKKDGTRIPFDRDKIRIGLEKACYKRPVSADQIERIISEVEIDVSANFEREVPSRYIGEQVFNCLRRVDQVAFVRFASVYREFKDVNDFVEELQPMLRRGESPS
jgi:transcriptional repressor NrdR